MDSVAENEGPLVDPDFQMLVSLRLVPFSLTLQSVPERPVASRTQQLKADIEDLDLKIRMFEQQDSMIQREIQKLESQISEVAETSVDVEMMRPELEQLASILQTIASERERMRIEVQSEDRIRLRHNAQQPKAKNSLWDRLQRLLS